MVLQLDWTISVGNLLTSASIVVSAVALVYQLSKDRSVRQRQQANEIRAAAANTLASLERWRLLSQSFFDEIHPGLIETSISAAKGDDESTIRDVLTASAHATRLRILHRQFDDKNETTYTQMYQFHPSIKPFIEDVIQRFSDAERASFFAFLDSAQSAIILAKHNGDKKEEGPPNLRNALRNIADGVRERSSRRLGEILVHAEDYLSTIILQRDAVLLDQMTLQAPSPIEAQAPRDPFRPDPRLTPGEKREIDLGVICRPTIARLLRSQSSPLRSQVFRAYGIPDDPKHYQLDHLIPLKLGGASVVENLWPQSYDTKPWNAHVKDRLDNYLHRQVCDGKVPIEQAQSEIAKDWIAAYRKYIGDLRADAVDQPADEKPLEKEAT
jgi:hypothetical protein